MTSQTKSKAGPVRLVQAVLDLDYGDEQERTRYYEVHSVVVHVESIAMPLVGAAVLALAGPGATWPVLAMFAAWVVPMVVLGTYLQRYHVRMNTIATSPKNRGYTILYLASSAIFVITLLVVNRDRFPWSMSTMAVGALIGAAAALVGITAKARKERAAG